MPQDFEFSDYEPLSRVKKSSKTRAAYLHEDWATVKMGESGNEGAASSNDESGASRAYAAENPTKKVEIRGKVLIKEILARGHGQSMRLVLFTPFYFFDRMLSRAVGTDFPRFLDRGCDDSDICPDATCT